MKKTQKHMKKTNTKKHMKKPPNECVCVTPWFVIMAEGKSKVANLRGASLHLKNFGRPYIK